MGTVVTIDKLEKYISVYKVDDNLYIAHDGIFIYGLNQDFKVLWSFTGEDVWITRSGESAISLADGYIVAEDWRGHIYHLDYSGCVLEFI